MKKLLLILPVLFIACQSDDEETPELLKSDQEVIDQYLNLSLSNLPNYETPDYPIHYDPITVDFNNIPEDNPITNKGAQLGRVLFYDVKLSMNNTISCSSCHKQDVGFSDEAQFSTGFEGGLTGVHSMRLLNAQFFEPGQFFWDKRAETLEDQIIGPIQDHIEMGFTEENGGLNALVEKLEIVPYYPILFKEAFGDKNITVERLQKSVAQFIRSMVSTNSKFDEGFSQAFNPLQEGNGVINPFPNFTGAENRGKLLFMTRPFPNAPFCAGCHRPPTFALTSTALGNGLFEGQETVFKSPSLKSIALEQNFMHDGQFSTLEEVIEHYNSGVQTGPATDPFLLDINGQPHQLGFSEQEKADLVAFLQTLTDNTIAQDEKFADPFK